MPDPSVLIIEPDAILLDQYATRLEQDFEVWRAHTAQEAIDALDRKHSFDLIVMDFNLGKNNGVEVLHEIRSYDDWLHIPVMMLSSIPKNRLPLTKLARYGVTHFLYKPQTAPHELLRQARRTIPA